MSEAAIYATQPGLGINLDYASTTRSLDTQETLSLFKIAQTNCELVPSI